MKITYINGREEQESGVYNLSVSVGIVAGSLLEAINKVATALSGVHVAPASSEPEAPVEETTTRRRRSTTEAPAEDKPAETTTRRRRALAEAPATAEEAPAEPAVRRRRSAEPEVPAGITGADLTQAASDAAAGVGTKVVTALLAEFDADMTSDIKQEDRQEFLDLLKTNIEDFRANAAKGG